MIASTSISTSISGIARHATPISVLVGKGSLKYLNRSSIAAKYAFMSVVYVIVRVMSANVAPTDFSAISMPMHTSRICPRMSPGQATSPSRVREVRPAT